MPLPAIDFDALSYEDGLQLVKTAAPGIGASLMDFYGRNSDAVNQIGGGALVGGGLGALSSLGQRKGRRAPVQRALTGALIGGGGMGAYNLLQQMGDENADINRQQSEIQQEVTNKQGPELGIAAQTVQDLLTAVGLNAPPGSPPGQPSPVAQSLSDTGGELSKGWVAAKTVADMARHRVGATGDLATTVPLAAAGAAAPHALRAVQGIRGNTQKSLNTLHGSNAGPFAPGGHLDVGTPKRVNFDTAVEALEALGHKSQNRLVGPRTPVSQIGKHGVLGATQKAVKNWSKKPTRLENMLGRKPGRGKVAPTGPAGRKTVAPLPQVASDALRKLEAVAAGPNPSEVPNRAAIKNMGPTPRRGMSKWRLGPKGTSRASKALGLMPFIVNILRGGTEYNGPTIAEAQRAAMQNTP